MKKFTLLFSLFNLVASLNLFGQFSFVIPPYSLGSIIDSGTAQVIGTAFVIGKRNRIVTCEHVTEQNKLNLFRSYNGEVKKIVLEYASHPYDFAVSKFNDAVNYNHWDFGDFKSIKPGDTVIYIGWNYNENSYKVDMASVSSIGSYKNDNAIADFLEFEGYGIPGYSGGPVLNKHGKVVAIMREAWTRKGVKGGPEKFINRAFSIEPIRLIEENTTRY